MADIYSQEFLYHYKSQPNNKHLDNADYEGKDVNYSCGDEIEVQLKVDEQGKIIDIGYNPKGCVISTGTMAILSEHLIGEDVSKIESLDKNEVLDLIGIEVTPSREKCVLVGVNALKNAVNKS